MKARSSAAASEAAKSRHLFLHRHEFGAEQREIAAPAMRQAAGDHGVGHRAAPGDAQALVVQECALAALGDEHLVR